MDKTTRGSLEMATAMVISGTIGWVVVSSGQPVADLLFWRCVFGAATLLAFCAALGLLRGLTWRRAAWCAAGGVAIVLNWVLLFGSYAHAPISLVTAVYNTQPLMLVALGVVFLRERLRRAHLGWLALAFAGVLLVAQGKPVGASAGGGHYLTGVAMALGAAFCYAIAALVAKRLDGTPPHLVALVQVCVGALMLAPWAMQGGLPAQPQAWAAFLVLGVVYTGLVYILLYGALQKLPTALAGGLSFLYPVVAVLVDYLVFGQRLDLAQALGAAAVLGAAAGLAWSRRL